jgi:hypothetical protein
MLKGNWLAQELSKPHLSDQLRGLEKDPGAWRCIDNPTQNCLLIEINERCGHCPLRRQ